MNDTLLTQLIKDGKIDDTKVARARRVRSVYRIVVQSLPNISPPLRPVSKESPVISPVQPLSGKKARSRTGGQQGKAREKTPRPGGRQKPEKQLKDTEKQPKIGLSRRQVPVL